MKIITLILIALSSLHSFAEEQPDFIVSRTKSPDDRYSIALDGILGPAEKPGFEAHEIHVARLFDRKAGKFIGRKIPLVAESAHIDMNNRTTGEDGWRALWSPDSAFVVLSVPVTAGKEDGWSVEYFYFQVTETGILPVALPHLEAHIFRIFDRDEGIAIARIKPLEWTDKNRLKVHLDGSHFDGVESPDFRKNGVLKFSDDGNVTVEKIEDIPAPPDFEKMRNRIGKYYEVKSPWTGDDGELEQSLYRLMTAEVGIWEVQQSLKARNDEKLATASAVSKELHEEILCAATRALPVFSTHPNPRMLQLLVSHLEAYPYSWAPEGWEELLPSLKKLL